MREIKFRFWDPDTKTMSLEHPDATIWNGLLVCEGDTVLMQFTGMKDRKGNEIYEGDILKETYGIGFSYYLCKIGNYDNQLTYEDNECGNGVYYDFLIGLHNGKPFHDGSLTNGMIYPRVDEMDVIGNIYENSELLESNDGS